MSLFHRNKSLIIFAFIILVQMILLSFQLPRGQDPSYLERTFFSILSPLQRGIDSLIKGFISGWENYIYLRDVKKENEILRKEILTLKEENILLRQSLKDYETLIKMKSNLKTIEESIISAKVIGLDPSNYFRSITINRGSKDGIRENMAVLDPRGFLVGRTILPISRGESRVHLVTDTSFAVSVETEKKEIVGILSGDGKGGCYLKYVLETEKDISEGDRLITTGYDGIFPPGILVGIIASIVPGDTLFKEIMVNPFFDFRHLNQVAVIRMDAKNIFGQ